MNAREFVDAINGKQLRHTRTLLSTGEVEDDSDVIPSRPTYQMHGAAIAIGETVFCYEDKDLFTEEHGVWVAVIKSGTGHLWCDRFVPVVPVKEEAK